jgi:hypothetical protein
MQVGPANAATADPHQHFTGSRPGHRAWIGWSGRPGVSRTMAAISADKDSFMTTSAWAQHPFDSFVTMEQPLAPAEHTSGIDQQPGLGPLLRAAHEIWIDHTERYLIPVIVTEASFWERWTAVRYLADEFSAQLRRESALLEELRSFLAEGAADQLLEDGARIGQLQQELDRLGRRRGTGYTVSVAARKLLELVRAWCTDFEAAAWHTDLSALPDEALQPIGDLKRYVEIHG